MHRAQAFAPDPEHDPSRDNGVLLRRARDGDQRAWDELVERYTGMLWSIGRGYRLNTADTADATQTTWLRLLEHLGTIRDPARLAAWLATTMRRECLNTVRRGNRERPQDLGLAADIADAAEPVDADLVRTERDAALRQAVHQLPVRCQYLLRILMAEPAPARYQAAASLLDMPLGSVGPTRLRCLDTLRRLLARQGA